MAENDKIDITQQQKTHFDEEKGIKIIKYALLGIGSISFIVGLIRQWPVLGKGYMAFIEGNGYMALIMGLIIIILGFSVRLFVIDDAE
jgi:vacuolar-type H+-ATPase subunit I/STV1